MPRSSPKAFEHGKMVLSSSTITTKNEYKPGRMMIIGQDDIVGRMVATGNDGMGRWSWTKLSGSRGKGINFIVVYQVCSLPTNKTGITAYHQQENILRLERPHFLTQYLEAKQRIHHYGRRPQQATCSGYL
jgi:hypothetical protein